MRPAVGACVDAAAIGVMDEAASRVQQLDGFVEHVEGQLPIVIRASCPADYAPRERVENCGQVVHSSQLLPPQTQSQARARSPPPPFRQKPIHSTGCTNGVSLPSAIEHKSKPLTLSFSQVELVDRLDQLFNFAVPCQKDGMPLIKRSFEAQELGHVGHVHHTWRGVRVFQIK